MYNLKNESTLEICYMYKTSEPYFKCKSQQTHYNIQLLQNSEKVKLFARVWRDEEIAFGLISLSFNFLYKSSFADRQRWWLVQLHSSDYIQQNYT